MSHREGSLPSGGVVLGRCAETPAHPCVLGALLSASGGGIGSQPKLAPRPPPTYAIPPRTVVREDKVGQGAERDGCARARSVALPWMHCFRCQRSRSWCCKPTYLTQWRAKGQPQDGGPQAAANDSSAQSLPSDSFPVASCM